MEVSKDPQRMVSMYPSLYPGKIIKSPFSSGNIRLVGMNGCIWYVPVANNPYESGRVEYSLAWMMPSSWRDTDSYSQSFCRTLFFEIQWPITEEEFQKELQREDHLLLHSLLVQELDACCRSSGQLVWNLSPYCLRRNIFECFSLSDGLLYAHVGFVLTLNLYLLRFIPYIALGTVSTSLKSLLVSLQPYLLATTKDLIASLRIEEIRTPISLQSDLSRLPPEVKTYKFNRLAARRERLLSLPEGSDRLKASILGAVTELLLDLPPKVLRIGYIHQTHGGQRRAFHVQFIGEGGIDNGGLYRELFRSVMQELHDLSLFSYLIYTPNHTQVDAEHGRDDYLFNPAVGEQDMLVFEGLGRVVATAIMSGFQLDLFLSLCIWKMTVREPLTVDDMEYVDVARWKRYKQILQCDVSVEGECDL